MATPLPRAMKRVLGALLALSVLLTSATHASASEPRTIERLLNDLRSPDYEAAWSSAQALGKSSAPKPRVVPALLDALKRTWARCTGDIHESVARALADLGAREAVVPLLEVVKRGHVAHECAECGNCFLALTPGDLVWSRQYDPFGDSAVLSAIHTLADYSHSKPMADLVTEGTWRPQLLVTLGRVGLPRYAYFISKYKDDPEPQVRRAVAAALGLIDNDAITVPVLLQLLSRAGEEFFVKVDASDSLVTIGKRRTPVALAPRLTELLKAPDRMTALLAARTLAALGREAGVLALRAMAASPAPRIRSEAVTYLGEVADAGAKDLLVRTLRDGHQDVRASAIYALGRLGDRSVIPALQKAVEEPVTHPGEMDLRQTLQEAVESLDRKR